MPWVKIAITIAIQILIRNPKKKKNNYIEQTGVSRINYLQKGQNSYKAYSLRPGECYWLTSKKTLLFKKNVCWKNPEIYVELREKVQCAQSCGQSKYSLTTTCDIN